MVNIVATNTLYNLLQLVGLIILFILILVATYFVSKWVGTSGIVQPKTRNISLVESFRIGPNKYIQIITLGNKHYAIGITKEQITYITDLSEDQLDLEASPIKPAVTFKDVLQKLKKK